MKHVGEGTMKVYNKSAFSLACNPGIANIVNRTAGLLYLDFITLFTLKRLNINIVDHFKGWDNPAITVADGINVNEDSD